MRARAAILIALFLFFVFELSVVNFEHARASALVWQSAFPAKSCTPADSEIVQISYAPEYTHFPISSDINGRQVAGLIFDFNDCANPRANRLLMTAKAGGDFRVHRPPIGLTIFSNKYSVCERAKLGVGLANIPNADGRPHRLTKLKNRLPSIRMTQGYMDDANSGPVSQNKSFAGNVRLISSRLGGGFRGIHCDGSCVGGLFGDRNRLLQVTSVDLRDPPQAIGRPPEGASENCRSDDGESSDCIVVNSIAKPSPRSEQQLDKQGINGLILIVGIGVALWIAFRRQRKNLCASNNPYDKRGREDDV